MARLGEVRLFEELRITAAVMTPRGLWASPSDDHGMSVQMAHEYILVTMRGVPLIDEGIYTFRLAVSDLPLVSIPVPVLSAENVPRHSGAH